MLRYLPSATDDAKASPHLSYVCATDDGSFIAVVTYQFSHSWLEKFSYSQSSDQSLPPSFTFGMGIGILVHSCSAHATVVQKYK